MKAFIHNLIKFTAILFLYSVLSIISMPHIISLQQGPATKEQISRSFQNVLENEYESIILGNSRLYRGLNPDKFSSSTYNFSHDNDSYNQMFFKLKYLLDNRVKFQNLILGTDFFQFSFKSGSRNYVYADYLDEAYLNDFESNVTLQKIRYHLSNINPKKLLNLRPNLSTPRLKTNGQYIKNGTAQITDSVTRSCNRLSTQVEYFKKIQNLCKLNQITLFIVMPPTRQAELKSYSDVQKEEFHQFIDFYVDKRSSYYLDYSESTLFTFDDYTDITHLNELAANRFSEVVNKDVLKIINRIKTTE